MVGPARREDGEKSNATLGKEIRSEERTDFRAIAARLNFLSLDRCDIQFASKEICREMAKPTARGLVRAKRVVRYLVEEKRLIWRMSGK